MTPRRIAHHALGFGILLAFLFAGDGWRMRRACPSLAASRGCCCWPSPCGWGGSQSAVQPAAALLIRNLALLFVPAGVGVMVHADLLARIGYGTYDRGGSVAGTVAVLAPVAWLQQRQERRG